jgi:hypothetical protein
MRKYYEKWEFKHPQPQDIRQVFEEVTGKNLDWFFVDIITTTKQVDYKLKNVKINEDGTDVTIKNQPFILILKTLMKLRLMVLKKCLK